MSEREEGYVVRKCRVIRLGADELFPNKGGALWYSHATAVSAAINLLCPQAHAKPVQIGDVYSWYVEVHFDASEGGAS